MGEAPVTDVDRRRPHRSVGHHLGTRGVDQHDPGPGRPKDRRHLVALVAEVHRNHDRAQALSTEVDDRIHRVVQHGHGDPVVATDAHRGECARHAIGQGVELAIGDHLAPTFAAAHHVRNAVGYPARVPADDLTEEQRHQENRTVKLVGPHTQNAGMWS